MTRRAERKVGEMRDTLEAAAQAYHRGDFTFDLKALEATLGDRTVIA